MVLCFTIMYIIAMIFFCVLSTSDDKLNFFCMRIFRARSETEANGIYWAVALVAGLLRRNGSEQRRSPRRRHLIVGNNLIRTGSGCRRDRFERTRVGRMTQSGEISQVHHGVDHRRRPRMKQIRRRRCRSSWGYIVPRRI